jgi:hypothetical protein
LQLAHEVIVQIFRNSKSIEAAKLALSLVRLYEIDMKRS